jgi:hypothetical protein
MQANSLLPFLTVILTAGLPLAAAEPPIPPAFGPHVKLSPAAFTGVSTFTTNDRIVGTYYFYWYDSHTQSHVRDEDGTDALTTHPPSLEDFSYKSVRWHRQQLADMEAAGIDVALMVFWGSPAEHATNTHLHWSFAGLPPLVQAREELLRAGKRPPRLGLFYDTSTLRYNHWNYHADLTTDYGRRFFYATIRDFYSCLPPQHWALMNGQPIVLLYSPDFAQRWDQRVIDHAKAEFPKEFGGRTIWIAPQNAWNVKGDSTCAWGGALAYQNPGIGEIGPGYDHSAVPGRQPLVREREGGRFYEESWLKFLRRPSHFVMIETWNEFHEGTDIAESREYGRQYIELTRKYADRFKQGWKPPVIPGPFTGAKSVSVAAEATGPNTGLQRLTVDDGPSQLVERAGRRGWMPLPFRDQRVRYLYFRVEDSFKWTDAMNLTLTVDYFAPASGQLRADFDGSDEQAPLGGAYTATAWQRFPGGTGWQTATFTLPAAKLQGAQNAGADFRVAVEAADFAVGRVTVSRSE